MEEEQEHQHPNNALLFRLAVSNSFKHIAESVSEDEFLEALTILESKPKVAQKLHKAMVKELYESMNGDFEDILNEGSLQDELAKVSRLSENADASEDEDVWRPPGDVTLHLRSWDAEKIKEESELLERQVNKMEDENSNLIKTIAEKRSKVYSVRDNITKSLNQAPVALERLERNLEQLEKCFRLLERRTDIL